MKASIFIPPYLLLVSFYSGRLHDFDFNKINSLNKSPYSGTAVTLIGAYEFRSYGNSDYREALSRLKKGSSKHVWPWIFFNRFMGCSTGDNTARIPPESRRYFSRIKGLDINNEVDALGQFYELWRTAHRISVESGSPGIVVDPEAYNDYQNYSVAYVAKRQGISIEELESRLMKIGAELVDITMAEDPDAVIWFLFSGLDDNYGTYFPGKRREYRTITYIILGMLECSRKKKSSIKFISGGMLSLGYCHESSDELASLIAKRNKKFTPLLSTFPNLKIGGTIAPWNNNDFKKGYFNRDKCKSCPFSKIEDFKPVLYRLLSSYSYIWIYAAEEAGYSPYDKIVSEPYNRVINDAVLRLRNNSN